MKKLFFGESRFLMKEPTNKAELKQEIGKFDGMPKEITDYELKQKLDDLQMSLDISKEEALTPAICKDIYQRYTDQRLQESLLPFGPVPALSVAPAVAPVVASAKPQLEKNLESDVNVGGFPELNLNFKMNGNFQLLKNDEFKINTPSNLAIINQNLIKIINGNPTLQTQIKEQLTALANSNNPLVEQLASGLISNKELDIAVFSNVYSRFLSEKLQDQFNANYPNAFDNVDELKSKYFLVFKIEAEGGEPIISIKMPDEFEKEYREEGTVTAEDEDSVLDKKVDSMMKDPIMGQVFTIFGTGKEKVKDMFKDGSGWIMTLLAGFLGVGGFKSMVDTIKSVLPDKWKNPFEKIENMVNKRATKYLIDKAKKFNAESFGNKIDTAFNVKPKNGIALTQAFDLQGNKKSNWVDITIPADCTVRFSTPVYGAYILDEEGGAPLEEKKVNSLSQGTYRFQSKEIPAGTYFSKGVMVVKGKNVDPNIKYELPQEEETVEDGEEVLAGDVPSDEAKAKDESEPKISVSPKTENS